MKKTLKPPAEKNLDCPCAGQSSKRSSNKTIQEYINKVLKPKYIKSKNSSQSSTFF